MDYIKNLSHLFSKFPTIGPRTASRFVFYLIKQPKESIDELLRAIEQIKNKIQLCKFCFNPYSIDDFSGAKPETALCNICQNPSRNKTVLCVVEKEADLISIENTKKYNGLYFILCNGAGAFKNEEINNLRINELQERIFNPQNFGFNKTIFSEIIIATNPTLEGRAASVLILRALLDKLKSSVIKVTHLAKGIPFGGELEYADEETLESAFEGRK